MLNFAGMRTEMFIANRLRLTPSDGSRKSPAVAIAVAGMALAVAVMMISVAVVTGFQEGIRQKVAGFEPSISLYPLGNMYEGEEMTLRYTPQLRETIAGAINGVNVAEVVSQPAVLKTPDGFAGVVINGYGEGHDSGFEKSNILEGELPVENEDIMISSIVASRLGLAVGDKVDGCFFVDGGMKLRRYTITAIYSSYFSDYDRITSYANIDGLRRLRGLAEDECDMIEIRGIDMENCEMEALKLHAALSRDMNSGKLTSGYGISTILDNGAMYFNWLALLDTNVVVILIIMGLISGFTLVSCLFILILQRVGMIGLLKGLGATGRQILLVFTGLSAKIIITGMVIGNVVGLVLLFAQKYWRLVKLDPDAYFLNYVPIRIDTVDIIVLNVGVLVFSFLLTLLSSAMIAKISPARTMRYE